MRVLHAIHDFLPRHQAGSELYADALCRALQARGHHLHVLAATYDRSRRHGTLVWRAHDGLPVTEVVNNWQFASFAESYRYAAVGRALAQVLDAVEPEVLHIHNLLNLSFDLPALARARGIPSAATLHDYTLVCPSGGQRVHLAAEHVCHTIDADRCSRCFVESPFHAQMAYARLVPRSPRVEHLAHVLRRRLPRLFEGARQVASRATGPRVTPTDIERRLADARRVLGGIDLLVAPSRSLADEMVRLGAPAERLEVSDYGFPPLPPLPAVPRRADGYGEPLRLGYVGTLVWHKGIHVLLEALRLLDGERLELEVHGDPDTFPAYAERLRAASAALPVRFLGRFESDRRAEVYARLDVLVVPSLWPENSPLVVHEAFQAGLPVVAARMGGIAELVADGRSGLLYDATSAADLARCLRSLLHDRTLLARLARDVPPLKSIGEDAAAWEGRYRSLLARAAGTGR